MYNLSIVTNLSFYQSVHEFRFSINLVQIYMLDAAISFTQLDFCASIAKNSILSVNFNIKNR